MMLDRDTLRFAAAKAKLFLHFIAEFTQQSIKHVFCGCFDEKNQ